MTTKAITPLRRRMIEDMNARKLGPHSPCYGCGLRAGEVVRHR